MNVYDKYEVTRRCSPPRTGLQGCHLGLESRAYLKSIFYRCHLLVVAFVWELTKETIHLPLGCLQGRVVLRCGMLGRVGCEGGRVVWVGSWLHINVYG